MAHWFGILPWQIEDLSYGEVDELIGRLRKLPPVGGVFQFEPKK